MKWRGAREAKQIREQQPRQNRRLQQEGSFETLYLLTRVLLDVSSAWR